jgi:hypothetical protein
MRRQRIDRRIPRRSRALAARDRADRDETVTQAGPAHRSSAVMVEGFASMAGTTSVESPAGRTNAAARGLSHDVLPKGGLFCFEIWRQPLPKSILVCHMPARKT